MLAGTVWQLCQPPVLATAHLPIGSLLMLSGLYPAFRSSEIN